MPDPEPEQKDLDELLIDFITDLGVVDDAATEVTSVVCGETHDPLIFIIQTGENESEAIGCDEIESTEFAIEIYSEDIELCRDLSKAIKQSMRELETWSTDFEGRVQFISVRDVDHDYVRKLDFGEEIEHNADLFIELHH